MRIISITSVIVLIFLSSNLYSFESPFNFLRYVSNARAAGLSNAFVTMEDDIGTVFFNPAAISTVEDKQLGATFMKHVLDINSGNIAYMYDLPNYGKLAAHAGFTSYGSFDYADEIGNRTGGTFTANDIAIGVTYSDELDSNFFYGITAKFINVTLEDASTSAVAFDAGLFYKLSNGRTNLGISLLHAGTQLTTIDGVNEDLPVDFRIGVNHRLEGLPLLLNFNFHHLADETDSFTDRLRNFAIGGEIYLGESIRVRGGYDNQIRTLTDADVDSGLTGFSLGAGFRSESFDIDYAFSRYGQAANLHRITISFDFSRF